MSKGDIFVAVVLVAILTILLVVTGSNMEVKMNELISVRNNDFEIISESDLNNDLKVITFYDKENHITYLYVDGYKAGGLCPLYNSDGNLFIYQGD